MSQSQPLPAAQAQKSNPLRTAVGSSSIGKLITLLPHASSSFSLAFAPSRLLRETLSLPIRYEPSSSLFFILLENLFAIYIIFFPAPFPRTIIQYIYLNFRPDAGPLSPEIGFLTIAFSTGQRLVLPLSAMISTPFLAASSPLLFFGSCLVGEGGSEGTLLLTNPTPVSARWGVSHVPGGGAGRRLSAIKVPGYEASYAQGEGEDDPSVFIITPSAGVLQGPTVSVAAATAAPPKDVNRRADLVPIVPQRLAESSWATSTLTLRDTVAKRHDDQKKFEADSCYPLPITIKFLPTRNVSYSSRFRFTCDFGNSFDVMLTGAGTHEEHEHKPVFPAPR